MVRTGLQRLEDNINFLRSVPLLQNLNNDVLAKIADVLEVVSSWFKQKFYEIFYVIIKLLGVLSKWCIYNSSRCNW